MVALRKESVDRNHDGMLKYRDAEQSLSARRAWIEISEYRSNSICRWSLSARRAWIEIKAHALSVTGSEVALRKESVDRNNKAVKQLAKDNVALRKESVDRNPPDTGMQEVTNKSLSARRAWIEITFVASIITYLSVALRKESVDRNIPRPADDRDI